LLYRDFHGLSSQVLRLASDEFLELALIVVTTRSNALAIIRSVPIARLLAGNAFTSRIAKIVSSCQLISHTRQALSIDFYSVTKRCTQLAGYLEALMPMASEDNRAKINELLAVVGILCHWNVVLILV
jgi:hypothetical protein